MKHLCLIAAIFALLLAAASLTLLATGRTALVSDAGLVKLAVVAAVVAAAGFAARWITGRLEHRDHRRWILAAHPVAWLLVLIVLGAALGVGRLAWQRATAPSWHGDWSVGIYVSRGTEPADFEPLGDQPVLAADHVTDLPCAFVADPVLVDHGDGYALFYEAWNTRSGHGDICVSTSRDGLTWIYGGRVLDEACSLSYPTVFRHDGSWFMIPETRELGELRLYRAERFPDQWVLDRVLLDGAPYRDTNVIEHDGLWYLLTTADYGTNLLIFHADDPRGPWHPHARNPVVTDDGDHARGGGSVVVHDGELRRFAQDVTPYYGNRVRALDIAALSPTEYVQTPADGEPALVGHDAWNVRGMHTLWCIRLDDGRWLAAVDGHGLLVDTKPRWRD